MFNLNFFYDFFKMMNFCYFCWFGQNYIILRAHLASLLQLGYLKSQLLQDVMKGLVNGWLGKIIRSAPILLERQQRLVMVAIDITH